MFRCQSKIERR